MQELAARSGLRLGCNLAIRSQRSGVGLYLESPFGWTYLVVFMLGALAKPGWACAQAPSSAHDSAVARALFREGVACADAHDWECAADRFARAREVRPSPVLAYNLGHALIELGRFVEGTEILTQLLRDPALQDGIRADAERTLSVASEQIAQLSIEVSGPLDGTAFTLDGRELGTSLLGTLIPVDPGERLIEAHRAGEVVARARVVALSGQPAQVTLTLPDPPASDDLDLAPSLPLGTARSALAEGAIGTEQAPGHDDTPWIALGIGGAVAVIGGAIVLGIVLAQPGSEPAFEGNLGHVEIGGHP